jgi:hypothetical protein
VAEKLLPVQGGEMRLCQWVGDNIEISCTDCEKLGSCPYAPILKLLAEAKEVKGPNDKSAMRYKTIRGDTMEEWESYTFWTRR